MVAIINTRLHENPTVGAKFKRTLQNNAFVNKELQHAVRNS